MVNEKFDSVRGASPLAIRRECEGKAVEPEKYRDPSGDRLGLQNRYVDHFVLFGNFISCARTMFIRSPDLDYMRSLSKEDLRLERPTIAACFKLDDTNTE